MYMRKHFSRKFTCFCPNCKMFAAKVFHLACNLRVGSVMTDAAGLLPACSFDCDETASKTDFCKIPNTFYAISAKVVLRE